MISGSKILKVLLLFFPQIPSTWVQIRGEKNYEHRDNVEYN